MFCCRRECETNKCLNQCTVRGEEAVTRYQSILDRIDREGCRDFQGNVDDDCATRSALRKLKRALVRWLDRSGITRVVSTIDAWVAAHLVIQIVATTPANTAADFTQSSKALLAAFARTVLTESECQGFCEPELYACFEDGVSLAIRRVVPLSNVSSSVEMHDARTPVLNRAT